MKLVVIGEFNKKASPLILDNLGHSGISDYALSPALPVAYDILGF
jgi:hypothetical protein